MSRSGGGVGGDVEEDAQGGGLEEVKHGIVLTKPMDILRGGNIHCFTPETCSLAPCSVPPTLQDSLFHPAHLFSRSLLCTSNSAESGESTSLFSPQSLSKVQGHGEAERMKEGKKRSRGSRRGRGCCVWACQRRLDGVASCKRARDR